MSLDDIEKRMIDDMLKSGDQAAAKKTVEKVVDDRVGSLTRRVRTLEATIETLNNRITDLERRVS